MGVGKNERGGLRQSVDKALKGIFPVEKLLAAHIALARIKGKAGDVFQAMESFPIKEEDIRIRDFRLMRSVRTPKGLMYGRIATVSAKK